MTAPTARRPVSPQFARRDLLAGAAATALFSSSAALAVDQPLKHIVRVPVPHCCPIIELRQYTLRTGQREPLIELFRREFIDTQEAVGIRVIGQFRDLDDPNRFVWLRGFESMEARGKALASFYGGPAWKAHRTAANATMIDSDNVLLLRPSVQDGGFDLLGRSRQVPVTSDLFMAVIHYLEPGLESAFAEFFEMRMRHMIKAAGADILATMVSETSPNSFPPLPIRQGEHVFIWFARFAGLRMVHDFEARLRQASDWRDGASPLLLRQFARKPEVLRLAPTMRSLLS